LKAKTILQFALGPIGAALLGFITLPFVAWFFTVEDVGRLTMLQVVLGLAVSLFSLSMHQAYVREYHEKADKEALLKLSILPGLALITIVALIALLQPYSISKLLFGIDSNSLTVLLFVGLLASFFINFLAHVIRMQERGLAFSITQIAPKLFLLILISLIMLFGLKAEFYTLMSMNTLAISFSLIIFAWLTKGSWIAALTKRIDTVLLKGMLTFSLPLVAGGIAYWGVSTMDRFFLRSLSGFEELGIYSLAAALAGVVAVVTSIFSSIWHPLLYRWVKEGSEKNKIECVVENMVLFVVLIWSLFGLLSFIIPIFLPQEYSAIEYLIVACVAMPLFYLLSEVTGVGIGITRRTNFSMLASFIAFLVNATLNYLLIPYYGASGAALASIFAFFIFFTVKTESSANIWKAIPRVKIYVLMIGYVAATCIMVITKANEPALMWIWAFLLILSCALFSKRLAETYCYLKNYLIKRV